MYSPLGVSITQNNTFLNIAIHIWANLTNCHESGLWPSAR